MLHRVPGSILLHVYKRWLAKCGLLIPTKIVHVGRVIFRKSESFSPDQKICHLDIGRSRWPFEHSSVSVFPLNFDFYRRALSPR